MEVKRENCMLNLRGPLLNELRDKEVFVISSAREFKGHPRRTLKQDARGCSKPKRSKPNEAVVKLHSMLHKLLCTNDGIGNSCRKCSFEVCFYSSSIIFIYLVDRLRHHVDLFVELLSQVPYLSHAFVRNHND